ncbi:hypothetical protein DFH07DRAFT_946800 [Mycena maculata]|uniref:F-box domain-containing protein n=1 Tax=Mycena maculata TaxID=230809 RepID=A0AAD7HK60_9AGAR|nr:hypothetical protein DFH07DRAFT_946800 [Mycena maculata]
MEGRLPEDLERYIFELVALSRPVAIPTLILVARRVKNWIEPLLYRVIVLDSYPPIDGLPFFASDVLYDILRKKPKPLLEHCVKHLIVTSRTGGGSSSQLRSMLLLACTGITDLAIQSEVPLATHELFAIAKFTALRYLAVHLQHLFRVIHLDFTHPVFRHLTHLEVRDMGGLPDTIWEHIIDIPNLTHLAFRDVNLCPIFGHALDSCPRLECLVFLCQLREDILLAGKLVDDPRFVALKMGGYPALPDSQRDWQRNAIGDSYWASADRFVAAKKAGEINTHRYRIDIDDGAWGP